MTDYEHIVISAVRYALGRMTYIVELTVDYILEEIEYDKLSDSCLNVIRNDIKESNMNSSIYQTFLLHQSKEYLESTNIKRQVIDFISGMTDDFLIREIRNYE